MINFLIKNDVGARLIPITSINNNTDDKILEITNLTSTDRIQINHEHTLGLDDGSKMRAYRCALTNGTGTFK